MNSVNSANEIEIVRQAAAISTQILRQVYEHIKPGVNLGELNVLVGQWCEEQGVKPAFLGQHGPRGDFKANICISVNDAVLHGFPGSDVTLKAGDIVKLDFGIIHKGMYTDHCVTVGVGSLSIEDERLVRTTKLAVEAAVAQVKAGVKTGNLGATMHGIVRLAGFDVLKEYVGHGIGHKLHLNPEIPAYGKSGSGEVLEAGMVVCIEAQVVAGSDDVYTDNDGWTVKTRDKSNGAMFEYMVLVGNEQSEVLTQIGEWALIVGN